MNCWVIIEYNILQKKKSNNKDRRRLYYCCLLNVKYRYIVLWTKGFEASILCAICYRNPYCNIRKSNVLIQTIIVLDNLALYSPTTMSSVFDDPVYAYERLGNGSLAVNGEVRTDDEECAVTNNDLFPFLTIDLLDIFHVGRVVFTNRLKAGMAHHYILQYLSKNELKSQFSSYFHL